MENEEQQIRYTSTVFRTKIGISESTLRRLHVKGILPKRQTATGRYYYLQEDIDTYFNIRQEAAI